MSLFSTSTFVSNLSSDNNPVFRIFFIITTLSLRWKSRSVSNFFLEEVSNPSITSSDDLSKSFNSWCGPLKKLEVNNKLKVRTIFHNI